MNQSSSSILESVKELFSFFSNAWFDEFKNQQAKQIEPVKKRQRTKAQSKREPSRFYERIFSLRVTLFYLSFQWLNSDKTCDAVIKDLRAGGADHLGSGRGGKLSERLKSRQTTSYSDARQRLPESLISHALRHFSRCLPQMIGLPDHPSKPPPAKERSLQLMDGSTLAMLRNPAIEKDYPPASNQHGPSDWSLMRIAAAFCSRSGAVMAAAQAAITTSEQQLAWKLFELADAFTLWIGDRNFGVFSVVEKARRLRQDVLLRLTEARARKLLGARKPEEDQLIQWSCTRHDQLAAQADCSPVHGRLIYAQVHRNGFRSQTLWLFTTLLDAQEYPPQLLLQWYGLRWQAELNFRYLKRQLDMHILDVKTPAMARKEFFAGLLAYNLVRAVMYAGGARIGVASTAISFSQARRLVFSALQRLASSGISRHQLITWLIDEIGHQLLPKRKRPRPSEPRRVRMRPRVFPPLRGSRAVARARLTNPATQCKS
jgi:hypothetical protein